MALSVAMLLMALLAASSAYSPVGVSLVSRSRVLPARPHGLQRLRMEEAAGEKAEEKAEEAAPAAAVDFTPATPTPAAEEGSTLHSTASRSASPSCSSWSRPLRTLASS